MNQSKRTQYFGYAVCILIIIGIFKFKDHRIERDHSALMPVTSSNGQLNASMQNLDDDDLTKGILQSIAEEKKERAKTEVENLKKKEKELLRKDMEALTFCQTLVERSLKAPSSADIPFAQPIVDTENALFTVSSYVDAQNGFGAIIRTNYICILKFVPDQAVPWKVERFEFLN